MIKHSDFIEEALRTNGGHLSIGRGGFGLCFRHGSHLSGYDVEPMKAECIARGLPVIDTHDIPIEILVIEVMRNPMVAVGEEPDPEPRDSLSRAPLADLARHYRDLGATVFNLELDGDLTPSPEA